MKKALVVGGSLVAGVATLLTIQAFRASRRAMTVYAMNRGHRKAFPLGVMPPESKFEEFGEEGNPPIHLVVIGDSTAVGVGASALKYTYPWLLADHLASRFRVRLNVIGRSGARMAGVAGEFVREAVAFGPDVAIIGIGANDVTHLTRLKTFSKNLRSSIRELEASAVITLVALGPRFDSPAIPQPLRALAQLRARALNRTIKRTAASEGVVVLDLPSGIGKSFALDRDLYCPDGFHPSDKGYALWAEVMKEKVMQAALSVPPRARLI